VRRLTILLAIAGISALIGCHRDQIIRPEPTEEGATALASAINIGDPNAAVQLVKGFHEIEEHSWRWTMGRFTLIFRSPEGAAPKRTMLTLRGNIPPAVLNKVGVVTLTALLGQDPVGSITLSKPGAFVLEAAVPSAALKNETITFDFVLDKFCPPGTLDPRELGVILTYAGLEIR